MGVHRINNTRTLQKNLRKKNKRSLRRNQRGGVVGGLGGMRTNQNRTIRTASGSTNMNAQQRQISANIQDRVLKDNAGRGFIGRNMDNLRDRFGSDDPRSESMFGKYGMTTAAGKRMGSNQGRFGQEYYDSATQIDQNKDDSKKKKYFNKRQARQYGLNIATLFDTAQKYETEDDDSELMNIAETYLQKIMAQAENMTNIKYIPGNYKRNIGQLTRVLPDYKPEFAIIDTETYEQHKAKVQNLIEKNYRTIEKAIKNYSEKKQQEYINNENQKYVGYPTLQKYKFLEDLEFQTQILERGKEYSNSLSTEEIDDRFKKEVFKLGIFSDEQMEHYLSNCPPGTKYERPTDEDKEKGITYGECVETSEDDMVNKITPWIFGEIIHIFDQFEYTCKQTDRAIKDNVNCGHRFRINKRKADNLKEKEYGYNKDYLSRLEKYVSVGGFASEELTIGDVVNHTDLSKGIVNKMAIVATIKDNSKLGKYKVAYLNNADTINKKKQLDKKKEQLIKLKAKLDVIVSQDSSTQSESKLAYDKMLEDYKKDKQEYETIAKLGDFNRDKNGEIILKSVESINLKKVDRISTDPNSSDYNPKYANFIVKQQKLFGQLEYSMGDSQNKEYGVELDKFSYASDSGFDKTGRKMSAEQDRIGEQSQKIRNVDADLYGGPQNRPNQLSTNVAGAIASQNLATNTTQGPFIQTTGNPQLGVVTAPNQNSPIGVQNAGQFIAGQQSGLPRQQLITQGGGAGDLVWKNSDGTTAQSEQDWMSNGKNVTKDKNKSSDKIPLPRDPDDKESPILYFTNQRARNEYNKKIQTYHETVDPSFKFQSKKPQFASRFDKALDRRKEHFEELCPQDLGCELIELLSVINPNLLSYEELNSIVSNTDNIEELKIIAEEHNCFREKIAEAAVATKGKPAIIEGKKKTNPQDALKALILSPLEEGGAQVINQDDRKCYILAYLELRDLPKIYIQLRQKLKKINSSSEAIAKIRELKEKYEDVDEAAFIKQLPSIPPVSKDRFPNEDSKLMYLLKELLLYDLEQKMKKSDSKRDLRIEDFKDEKDIIERIIKIDSKYVGIFDNIEEQKLIPEFIIGDRTLAEQKKEQLFNLLIRVIGEKEFTTEYIIQVDNIKKSLTAYLIENSMNSKWLETYVGKIGAWKLDIDDLKPLNLDVMLMSCKADYEDYLMRIPWEILNNYIKNDYPNIYTDLVSSKTKAKDGEVKDRARKIDKYISSYSKYIEANKSYLGDDQKIYDDVKRITQYQTPTYRDKLIEQGGKKVSLPNGTVFYTESEDDYRKLSKIVKKQKASQKITKLMREQLASKLAIDERKVQGKELLDDMNIMRYDLFVNKVGQATTGVGLLENLLDIFEPQHCAFTVTNCDIEQFNGEYYRKEGKNEFFKLDTSFGYYEFYMARVPVTGSEGSVSNFGLDDPSSIPDIKEKGKWTDGLEGTPWCLCARVKNTKLAGERNQSGNYIYYVCSDEGIKTNTISITGIIPKPSSNSYSVSEAVSQIQIPAENTNWHITPLGAKLLEFQEMGLQLGWPAYPYCAASTPIIDNGFWAKAGRIVGNVPNAMSSILGEVLPMAVPIGIGVLAGGTLWPLIAGGAGFGGVAAGGGLATLFGQSLALSATVQAVGGVALSGIAAGAKSKIAEKGGKAASRVGMLSKIAKSQQSPSLSRDLLSAKIMTRISQLGLKIRTMPGDQQNELYRMAGQLASNGKPIKETIGSSKINFFVHPIDAKLPTIDGKDRDDKVWWSTKTNGQKLDKKVVSNNNIKRNVSILLEEAASQNRLEINKGEKKVNEDGRDIGNKILYTVGPDGSYDDEGTRILNNAVSDYTRVTMDPNRMSTRGGLDRKSINKEPDFMGGTIAAFTKEECENPRLVGNNQRLYDVNGGSKEEAIEWILRPENINSLIVIANDMYSHDNSIKDSTPVGDDISEGYVDLNQKPMFFFGNNPGPIWANKIYGWNGKNRKGSPGEGWKQLDLEGYERGRDEGKRPGRSGKRMGEGRVSATESMERKYSLEVSKARFGQESLREKFNDPSYKSSIVELTPLTEYNKKRYDRFEGKGSQWYLKEAARKGLVDHLGRPIARLLDESNPLILEQINKTWPGGVEDNDLGKSMTFNDNVDKDGKTKDGNYYTSISDRTMIEFQNEKLTDALLRNKKFTTLATFGGKAVKDAMYQDDPYIGYLPGPLLLEIYYDKYPFNRYYKTNHDGSVDMKWSGSNLHGVWIDPRGQELISTIFTPDKKYQIKSDSEYKDLTDEEKEIAREFGKFTSREALGTVISSELEKGLKEGEQAHLFKFAPSINTNKVSFSFTPNKVLSNSEIPKFVPTKDMYLIEFTVGPVINSRRSYIDINKKFAIVWFNSFDLLNISISSTGDPYPIVNYSSNAGWAFVNLAADIDGKKSSGEILFYSPQPGYKLNSKEGYYCCSSENMPSREGWLYLESNGKSDNFDYKISDDLLSGLIECSKDVAKIQQGGIGGTTGRAVSKYLSRRGLSTYPMIKKYEIVGTQKNQNKTLTDLNSYISVLGSTDITEDTNYSNNFSKSFRIFTPVLYRNMIGPKAEYVHRNLEQWIRGICRAQANELGSAGPAGDSAVWSSTEKKQSMMCIDCVKKGAAWNRSMESYAFTAWAYSNNFQIGASIRLNEDVIKNIKNNLLQTQDDVTSEDIFMIVGYNGYWNSYGICDRVGPPGNNTMAKNYAAGRFVSTSLKVLGAIALVAILAGSVHIGGSSADPAVALDIPGVSDLLGALHMGKEAAGHAGQIDISWAMPDGMINSLHEIAATSKNIAAAAGDTWHHTGNPALSMIDFLEYDASHAIAGIEHFFTNTVGGATDFDHNAASNIFDWMTEYSTDKFYGGTMKDAAFGFGVHALAMGAVAGVAKGAEFGVNLAQDGVQGIGNFIDQKTAVVSQVGDVSDFEAHYDPTSQTIINPKDEGRVLSDKIAQPVKLGWSKSLETTNKMVKDGYPPQLFYYAKTGDESMPNRLINGVEIYLQRLTNIQDNNRFVTLSVPFSGDVKPGDRQAETSEGLYDIRKGWQIPNINKTGNINQNTPALERAVMGVKNRIKDKLIPHYELNMIRNLFKNIDEKGVPIDKQLDQYMLTIERYANIRINDCMKIDENLSINDTSMAIQTDLIMKSTTVDEELCTIKTKYEGKQQYGNSDGIVVVHEDKKILLQIVKALTLIILSGRFKTYNPEFDRWEEKESIPECDKALQMIEEHKKKIDMDGTYDRLHFHKYQSIMKTLNGHIGYTISTKNYNVEWFSNQRDNIKLLEYLTTDAEKFRVKDQLDRVNRYSENINSIHDKHKDKIVIIRVLHTMLEKIFKLVCIRSDPTNTSQGRDSKQIGNENQQYNSKMSLDGGVGFNLNDRMDDIMIKLDKEFPGTNHLATFKSFYNLLSPIISKQDGNYPISFNNYLLDNEHIDDYRVDTFDNQNKKAQDILILLFPFELKQEGQVEPKQREELVLKDFIISNDFISKIIKMNIGLIWPGVNTTNLNGKDMDQILADKVLLKDYIDQLKLDLPPNTTGNPNDIGNIRKIVNGIFRVDSGLLNKNIVLCLLMIANPQLYGTEQEIYLDNMLQFRIILKIFISMLSVTNDSQVFNIEDPAEYTPDSDVERRKMSDLHKEYKEKTMIDENTNIIDFGAEGRLTLDNNSINYKKHKIYNISPITKDESGNYKLSDVRGLRERYIDWFVYGESIDDYESLLELNEILAFNAIQFVNMGTIVTELERLKVNNKKMTELIQNNPELSGVSSTINLMSMLGYQYNQMIKTQTAGSSPENFNNYLLGIKNKPPEFFETKLGKVLGTDKAVVKEQNDVRNTSKDKKVEEQAIQKAQTGGSQRRNKTHKNLQRNNLRQRRLKRSVKRPLQQRSLQRQVRRNNRRTIRR